MQVGGGRLNAASEQVIKTLGSIPVTTTDLRRFLPYPELCDCDVCERIIFKTKTPLQNVYYLKGSEKKALRIYIQSNWFTIKRMIQSGESGAFPRILAGAIDEHIDEKITSLEYDLGALQDETEEVEGKIEEYESFR